MSYWCTNCKFENMPSCDEPCRSCNALDGILVGAPDNWTAKQTEAGDGASKAPPPTDAGGAILDFVNRDNVRRVSCLTLLDHYGLPEQMRQTIEECGELIVALRHFERGKATYADVVSEIADVIIMCEQMRFVFGPDDVNETIDQKLRRQMARVVTEQRYKPSEEVE